MITQTKRWLLDFIEPDKVTYNSIASKKATFKAGLEVPVHIWFKLTPSYSPDLVVEMLNTMNCSKDDIVLAPFSDASTTLIECQINGIKSFGFEINPLLYFVGKTSLNWDLSSEVLKNVFLNIEQNFSQIRF